MKKLIGILIAVIILLSGIVVYLVVTKDNNVSENPGGNQQEEQNIDYSKYVPSDGAYIKTVTRTKEINGKTEKLNVVVYVTEYDESYDYSGLIVYGTVLLNDKIIIEQAALGMTDNHMTINDIKNKSFDNEIQLTSIKDTKNSNEYITIDITGGTHTSYKYIAILDSTGNELLNEEMGGVGINLPNGEHYYAGEVKNNKIYDITCTDSGRNLDIIEIENGKVVKNSTTYPGNYFEGGSC